MKYSEMKETFQEELNFLKELTEYEYDLEQIHNMKEAMVNIEAWQRDGYDEFPKSFTGVNGPSIVMALWNTFIVPDEETKKAIQNEEYEERFKKEHPDWLAFDNYYSDGSCLFIDPETISFILQQRHYDVEHRELIVKALKAFHQNYMENM